MDKEIETRFVGLDQCAMSTAFAVYTAEGGRLFAFTLNSTLADLTDETFLLIASQLREVRSRLAAGELTEGSQITISPDGKIQVL